MNNDDNGRVCASGTGGAANLLVGLLASASSGWLEPLKIRRTAAAKAEEMRVVTEAEIEREQTLADARYRMQAMELRRQKNLESIAAVFIRRSPAAHLALNDEDWLAEFVESCKDTADPTLQDVWARLLTGELESAGHCSKRTLRMVKSLSRDEALLIKEVCRRVCYQVESDGYQTAFLNVFVNRYEAELDEEMSKTIPLFKEEAPGWRRRNERLIACGFLSDDDFKFSIDGEGQLNPAQFYLSHLSPRKIALGAKALVFDPRQPGLLFESKKFLRKEPNIRTPAASIEFDAWKLTPEGAELYHALREEPDYDFLATLHAALVEGGVVVAIGRL